MRGVSSSEITLGMSCALSGPEKELGMELYCGSQVYFKYVNSKGGVYGRKIRIKLYDDGYDPQRAVKNTLALIEKDKVFMLFGYTGTPTLTKVLPLLRVFESEHIYIFAPYTGAKPQRIPPYSRYAINIRASYQHETKALVNLFVEMQRKRHIGLVEQADAYGKSGEEGVRRALEKFGLKPTCIVTYRRHTKFDESMMEQVKLLRNSGAEAVIFVGTYGPCAAFIRDAREAGWDVPIATLSFAGCDNILDILKEMKEEKGKNYFDNLFCTQVVPSYEDLSLPLVREYRELMDEYKSKIPVFSDEICSKTRKYGFVSLEGFINAKVFVEVLKRCGRDLTPQRFMQTIETDGIFDIGMGQMIKFGPGKHQGLDVVYCMTVKDEKWVPIEHNPCNM